MFAPPPDARGAIVNWATLGPFSWPLWCGDHCIVDCLTSVVPAGVYGIVPHAVLQTAIFYAAAIFFAILKRRGVVWSHFNGIIHTAWHVPMLVLCVPFPLMALRSAYWLWQTGDRRLWFGPQHDPFIIESCVWFGAYLAVDTALVLLHGMMDKETAIHHAIFAFVCGLMFYDCATPLLGAVLLGQEISTPFLNVFLLLRGFRGTDGVTIAAFLCFAIAFYFGRVFLNSAVVFLFVREVYYSLSGPPGASALVYSAPMQLVLAAIVVAGWALQIHWAIEAAAHPLLPMSKRVAFADLPEKEVKREGGPLGGTSEEWDPFNAEELKVLRQTRAWMADTPGLFDSATYDVLACFLRGYAPLVNWLDHVYARLDATLRWRQEEGIDAVLRNEAWVSPASAALFERVLPCGPIGRDRHGRAVCLETPGASSKLLSQLFEEMDYETFLKCQIYNKEVQRYYNGQYGYKERRRRYKVVNVVDLSGFGSAHLKSIMMRWFKEYAAVFGQHYPETMHKTYVINAPLVFTGLWKVGRNFVHPVTAAKISVSSWGHESIFRKDQITLFDATIKTSFRSWRSVAQELLASGADEPGLEALAAGYAPEEDVLALKAFG